MSKTTPEEAKALGKKYCLVLYGWDFERLAALIDEVRGVDAEPVAWLVHPIMVDAVGNFTGYGQPRLSFADVYYGARSEPLYTHPAPSQPAASVELPVVMNKITPPPAYACIRRASGEDKCSRWCGDSAKCIASSMLEEAKAAMKSRYISQGAASEPESTNPYRVGSNAATWWQRGHDDAQAAIAAGRKAS